MKSDCKKAENKEFEIPKSGSLGLLALGYRGVQAWRKVRDGDDTDDSSAK